jgi:hypothetical protein
MKQHLLGLAVAILTFVLGWSIPINILRHQSEEVATLHLAATPANAWNLLLSFQGRDLTQFNAPTAAQLQLAIDKLVGTTRNQLLRPRLFSRLSTTQGEERYILIEESSSVTIPGNSRLRLSLFSASGILVSSSEFNAGWRIALTEIRLIQVNGIAGDVLEVESYPMINGADVAKQYYGRVDDEMRLIRLEDSSGALVPNVYRTPNHTIGFTPIGRSVSDWAKALESNDVAEVLAALTWLGGLHLDVDSIGDEEPANWHEYISEAHLAETTRCHSGVIAAVNALKKSDNPWVRDAAGLAAESMNSY